jgi:hypothetical protein
VPQSLLAVDFLSGPLEEDVVVGELESPDTQAVLRGVRGRFRPRRIVALRPAAGGSGTLDGLFMGRPGVAGDVTLFRCRDRTCAAPAVGAAAVAAASDPLGV